MVNQTVDANKMVAFLRRYNTWRRGSDIEQPHPTEIGEAIDNACTTIERQGRELGELHKDKQRLDFLLRVAQENNQFWSLIEQISKIDPAFDQELIFASREDIDELMDLS
jgi:hypothetical protein